MHTTMRFSHILLTRPLEQSLELAEMLASLGAETVVQPAFEYLPVDAPFAQRDDHGALAAAGMGDLVVFTSTRAVDFGLPQFSPGLFSRLRTAAIGPATEKALADAGVRTTVRARDGYTSEALLEAISSEPLPVGNPKAFIMAAPGGRTFLADGLSGLGWDVRTLMVYRANAAQLDRPALTRLEGAKSIISVWTSSNAMKALSQRLPPAAWFHVCQGEWLVISARLERLARAYGPAKIHMASGPGNREILSAIHNLA